MKPNITINGLTSSSKSLCVMFAEKKFTVTARQTAYGSKCVLVLSQPEGNVGISKIKRPHSFTPVDIIESLCIP